MNIISGGYDVFYLRNNYKSTALKKYQEAHDVKDGIVIQ